MTRRTIFLIGLFALAVLSGCGAAVVPSDWCYRYDFTTSDYSAVIYTGTWTPGAGFSPAGDTFDILIDHGTDVTPEQVIFQVRRGDANQVPMDVTVEVYAFGLWSGQRRGLVPASATSADLSLFPGNGSGRGKTFYAYGHSTRTFFLTGMVVLGNGSNPFPENNCGSIGAPTPTPVMLTLPEQELNQGLADANDQLESADVPLSAPDGIPLLPAETGSVVFGYAKWITSPVTAQELMGPFANVYYHVGYLIAVDVALVAVYAIIYGAVYVIRWVIWLYRSIVQIIGTIGSLTLPGIVLLLILLGVIFIGWLLTRFIGG